MQSKYTWKACRCKQFSLKDSIEFFFYCGYGYKWETSTFLWMQIFSVTIHILSKLTKDNFLWIGLIYTEGKLIGGGEGLVSFFFRLHCLFPIFLDLTHLRTWPEVCYDIVPKEIIWLFLSFVRVCIIFIVPSLGFGVISCHSLFYDLG